MNVLFVSQAAWDDRNSVGNTATNWFGDWQNDTFYHFYTRKSLPDNRIAASYYNISAKDVIMGLLKGKIEGRRFGNKDIQKYQYRYEEEHAKEQMMVKQVKGRIVKECAFFCSELIWSSGLWVNKPFKRFVDDLEPDAMFAFATNEYILKPLIRYLKTAYPKCKIILYIADDVHQQIHSRMLPRRINALSQLEYCFEHSDKIYGASADLCEKYNKLYSIQATPLYKGCSFENAVKREFDYPLKFVYAGNLLYGRDLVLRKLVEIISNINIPRPIAFLEVYSSTPIKDEDKGYYNIGNSAVLLDAKPYEEIKRIMADADVVLEIESFEESNFENVRYSFSTKVIDCLQSGNIVLGIGHRNQSAIEYLRSIEGSYIVDNLEDLEKCILNIVADLEFLPQKARAIREFAYANHDITAVREKLRMDFVNITQSS